MNKSAFSISIFVIGFILLSLLFSIFGILYFYWGSLKASQDAISTTVSLFGVIGTLGSASIAAYLFNDWRDNQTGINRSELAKNTQTSLYKLVGYLDYYHEFVTTQKTLWVGKNYPDVSQSFIDQAEKIPQECEVKRSIFRNECEELYKQFMIDLRIYEKTFDIELNLDISKVRYYRGSIGGMLRDLSQSKSEFELNKMTSHLKNSEKLFKENIVNIVTAEMSQYINLKVK
ncbi:TPA: hypothetical protein RHI02_003617 [Acinetobacter baumannii]|uniref:hypothetical protein n=1 Tax=Acinetobacter baumannii TaxID=470 RepID=UPI00165FA01B|nr:hypothetical protein [Acinetobacter baumannii]EHU1450427.1 hypothetical protein [Acinetobacter baumannii]EHU1801810.1 hypothetical protein [Acinetobacter baumannii]MBD0189352.1 hypothetical protein [Acinetobacter baumannii]HDV0585995.1 hypothetical protein [Acinetobacter baumannii]